MEDWLRRAIAELAAYGSNEVAPVDLTESLSAMAALLRNAVQSKPARNGAFIDPPVTAKAEDERPLRDDELSKNTLEGSANGSAATAPASAGNSVGTARELSRRLDELEQRLRQDAEIDGDQSLKDVLAQVETRLRQLTARRAQRPQTQFREFGETAQAMRETQSPPPGETSRIVSESPSGEKPDLLTRRSSDPLKQRDFDWPAFRTALNAADAPKPEQAAGEPEPHVSCHAFSSRLSSKPARQTRAATQKAEDAFAQDQDSRSFGALAQKIESAERQLAEKLDIGLAAATNETGGLKELVQALTDKIAAAPEPAPNISINALEREIAGIASRIDGADKGFASVASLEQTINRLFERLNDIHRTVSELASRSGAPQISPCIDCRDFEKRMVGQVAELRIARDEADKRVHLALNAVQETVGKVSDRLAKMEADVGEIRPGRDALLPVLAPRAERRRRGDLQNDSPQTGDLHRDSPGAEACEPVLIKTKEKHALDVLGRSGAEPASGSAGDLDKSAEPADFLIEPGSGFPFRREQAEPRSHVALAQNENEAAVGRADVIAAARTEQAVQRKAEGAAKVHQNGAHKGRKTGGFFSARRRPILLSLAALCLALVGYALAKTDGLDLIAPPSLLKLIGKGAAAPNTTTQSKTQEPTSGPTAAAHSKSQKAPNVDSLRNSGFLDPAPLAPAPASVRRQTAPSPRDTPSGVTAPICAIVGSDPVVVGEITSGHGGQADHHGIGRAAKTKADGSPEKRFSAVRD